MDREPGYLERILPQSTFGVTLLTIAIMILVVGFFVRGVQLFSVSGELPEGYVRMAARGQQAPDKQKSARPGKVAQTDPTTGSRIKLWGPYGENRAEEPAWAPGTVAPGYVATLVRTSDCRWAGNDPAPVEGAQFRVGQTLNVAAGLAEIAFACGAKAILQGPAEFVLHSDKSGSLRSGRMTADVPDDVQGFSVLTPTVEIISLSKEEQESVAKLSGTAECLWAKGTSANREGALLKPGQFIKLNGGLAEITFACGAKVILQGPASLEIETDKTAILHSGKLTADVPDDLEGFMIRTPLAQIISLPAEPKSTTDKDAKPATNAPAEKPKAAEPPKETPSEPAEPKPAETTPEKPEAK
jgi:hypothetical protein